MLHDPIDLAEVMRQRRIRSTGVIHETPLSALKAIDARIGPIVGDAQAVHGVDADSCPLRQWLQFKLRLEAVFGDDPPILRAAEHYLLGQFKLCLHCLGRKPLETDLEQDLANRLQHESALRRPPAEDVRRQVSTSFGRADIVTRGMVYEVKLTLTRASIFQAIGQATVYAYALGKPRIGIAGQRTADIDILFPAIKDRGIAVVLWDYPKRGHAS